MVLLPMTGVVYSDVLLSQGLDASFSNFIAKGVPHVLQLQQVYVYN